MAKNIFVKCAVVAFVFMTVACGGLHFNQLSPEAKEIHPKRVAVFPLQVWNHKEADSRVVVEKIVADALVERKWFENVMDAESLKQKVQESEELSKLKEEYLAKLQMLNFSDPELIRKIGDLIQVDSFLLLSVDEWKYYTQGDEKMAEVGLSMAMYDIATGKVIWKANHSIVEDYMLLKPELSKVARKVVHKMVKYMPH